MRDPSFISSSNRLRRLLRWTSVPALAAVVLVVCGELVLRRSANLSMDDLTLMTRAKRQVLNSRPSGMIVPVIGDSRSFHIDPRQLTPDGRGAANVSLPYFGSEMYGLIARAWKSRHGQPPVMLAALPYEMFALPPRISDVGEEGNLVRATEAIRSRVLLPELLRPSRPAMVRDFLFYTVAPPSVRYRTVVAYRLKVLAATHRWPLVAPADWHLTNHFREKGWFLYREREDIPDPIADLEERSGPLELYSNESVAARYREFVARTAASGEQLVLFMPPVLDSVRNRFVELGAWQQFAEYVGALQREFPNVVILFDDPLVLPRDCFSDATHVNEEGARRHNAWLRERLRQPLSPTEPQG